MTRLDPRPARDDLTSLECAKILGGTIGVLAELAPLGALGDAIQYWASPTGQMKLRELYGADLDDEAELPPQEGTA